ARLPNFAARRLSLRPFESEPAGHAQATFPAPCLARNSHFDVAHCSYGFMEANRCERTDLANRAPASVDLSPPLYTARGPRSASAALVYSNASHAIAIPSLRAFQRRVFARLTDLSHPFRNDIHPSGSSNNLGSWLDRPWLRVRLGGVSGLEIEDTCFI